MRAGVQIGAEDASGRETAIAFATLIAVALFFGIVFMHPTRPNADAMRYITYALNLVDRGTFSLKAIDAATPAPDSSFAPLYPAWVAAFAAFDGGLHDTLVCLARNEATGAACRLDLGTLIAAQLVLAGIFLGCVWLLARRLSGCDRIAWLAALCALLARNPLQYANHLLTEALLVPLLGVFLVCLAFAYLDRRPSWMLAAGAALGLAALTRPAYAYLFYVMAPALAVVGLVRWRRALLLGCALFAVAYGVVVSPWLARNKALFDRVAITTGYDGNILAQRVAYNRMGWGELGVAFVYWFPDFGDHLAAAIFPERYYRKLGWGSGSYYATVAPALYQESKRNTGNGETLVSYLFRKEVLAHPVKHALVSLPLAFRAIFISKYWGMVGLACFLVLAVRQIRKGTYTLLLLSLPVWFMVGFHALISVSIPRYNLALIPFYAYAMAWALDAGGRAIRSVLHRRTVVS